VLKLKRPHSVVVYASPHCKKSALASQQAKALFYLADIITINFEFLLTYGRHFTSPKGVLDLTDLLAFFVGKKKMADELLLL